MSIKLSVVTDPVPFGPYRISETARAAVRYVKRRIKPQPAWMHSPYRGHFAVTRSLVEGLGSVGVAYNYNPRSVEHVGEVLVVLSGLRTLSQAIRLKQCGRIKKLLAGPNIVEFPSDARALICAPEVDLCITPAPLTCRIYTEDCPELSGRCAAWPAGVDVKYWAPRAERERRQKILVYDKQVHGATAPVQPYVRFLRERGYDVTTLTYGAYARTEYREALQEAQLMIGFTAEESQGIAWAEAWAMNVPTFMWYKNSHSFNHPRSLGRTFETSPAPYISPDTGGLFQGMDDFERTFLAWERGEVQFQPRQWVLNNMSDEACARRLCEIAGIVTHLPVDLRSYERLAGDIGLEARRSDGDDRQSVRRSS